jgi:histidyl-tRNA synthetase
MFSAPKGTHDILSDQYYARQHVATSILRVLEKYGFRQVMTPAFEEIEVLKAKAGEAIIEQVYDFHDKGGRHLGLRSDITASVGRLVAAQVQLMPKPIKISSYDRLWRYESPQSGRYREFFQINAEMFGAAGPLADGELISCFSKCYDAVGLTDYRIHIGHRRLLEDFVRALGVQEDRLLAVIRAIDKAPKLSAAEYEAEVLKAGLPTDSMPRLKAFTNLRGPLGSTLASARELCSGESALEASLGDLGDIAAMLKSYQVDSKCLFDLAIARGSDYYTGVIFECVYNTALVGSIGGGGRYDNLVEVYGGSSTPATGFSVGFERVMILLNETEGFNAATFIPALDYYIVVVDETCLESAIILAEELRKRDKNAEIDLLRRKVRSQFTQASKLGARWTVVIGPEEMARREVVLRDMISREEKTASLETLLNSL